MKVEPFEMERFQSTWQNVVEYNLSDSGVRPLHFRDVLADETTAARFLDYPVAYSQTNGTPELRETIAGMYPGASARNVLVTNGSSEANFLVMWYLAQSGATIVHTVPSYLQIWGLARTFGLRVHPLPLDERRNWQFDPEHLKKAMARKPCAIAVCNPNNPTGAVIGPEERKALIDGARDARAWLLSDEVFQGAERVGTHTRSLWDPDGKTVITNGLSKAYGLPGLRIGWIVGPEDLISSLWSHHDYTTISPAFLSDRLAQLALEPRRRKAILRRTRAILRTNYGILERWIEGVYPELAYVPPTAGAICFLRYPFDLKSGELAMRLIKEQSTLVVPGEHFGLDGYLRVCYGASRDYLIVGLGRIAAFLKELGSKGPRRRKG